MRRRPRAEPTEQSGTEPPSTQEPALSAADDDAGGPLYLFPHNGERVSEYRWRDTGEVATVEGARREGGCWRVRARIVQTADVGTVEPALRIEVGPDGELAVTASVDVWSRPVPEFHSVSVRVTHSPFGPRIRDFQARYSR